MFQDKSMKLMLTQHGLLYGGSGRQTGSLFYLLAAQVELYILQNMLAYYLDLNCNDVIYVKIKQK
jgi:hypothetical protein